PSVRTSEYRGWPPRSRSPPRAWPCSTPTVSLNAAARAWIQGSIWSFQPAMLHAKIMTIDGLLANVGSANLNARSTALDEEINVVAIDRALTRTLDEHFDEDLTRSIRIEQSRWGDRSVLQRIAETAVGPIRRLF